MSMMRWTLAIRLVVLSSTLISSASISAAFAQGNVPPVRQTISLDGPWDFATDPKDEGEAGKWFLPGSALPAMPREGYAATATGKITVPGIWDCQGYGTPTEKLRHNFVGKGWYKRTAAPPALAAGQRAFLRITGVHRAAKVWLDDQPLGEHVGYLSPFEFDITGPAAQAAAGTKSLTVTIRVDSRQRWDVDGLFGAGDLADYFDAEWGGIWGHVSIEVRPETYLADLFVQPTVLPAPRCRVSAAVRGKPARATGLLMEVLDDGGEPLVRRTKALADPLQDGQTLEIASADLTQDDRGRPGLALAGPKLWTPDTPHLLTARLSLLDGERVLDCVETRFGLRQIEIRGPHFYLNGRRLFLRGYGDDHIYVKELARPSDKTLHLARLKLIKSYGFNFVRHHSNIMPPEYYEAADEVGMFVSAEHPIAYENFYTKAGPAAMETHKREFSAAILQLRNHPSIFDWCMGNEFWNGLPLGADFAAIARKLDPTRPFVDSDGLFQNFLNPAQKDRDTLDFYFLMFDVGRIPLDIPDKFRFEKPRKPVVSHETGNYNTFPRLDQFEQFTHNVKPYWTAPGIARLKALGLLAEADRWALNSERLYLFCHKNNIEAMRRNPYVSGHQWWLFQDYWTTSNGIVDFLFRPKPGVPLDEVRRIVNDVVLLADGLERTCRGKTTLKVPLVVSNYSPTDLAGAELTWRASLEAKPIAQDKHQITIGQGEVAPLADMAIDLPDVAQAQRLTVEADLTIKGDGAAPARRYDNQWTVWVYPSQIAPPQSAVPVYTQSDVMPLVGPLGAKPIPTTQPAQAKAVYVARRLDKRILDAAEQGAAIILLGGRDIAPTVPALFKTSWWKGSGPADNNLGTVVYDHPITRSMAPDGWCDAGWYSLIQHASKFDLEALRADSRGTGILPVRPTGVPPVAQTQGQDAPATHGRDAHATVDVIVRAIPHLHLVADQAFLFESRLGAGSILVSGLNHLAAKDRPEGQWLLAKMIEHAATLPKPKSELPLSLLRSKLPPGGRVVSGFARLIQKGEEGQWHTYREDNVAVYACRQTKVGNMVEWETAAVPADWPAEAATFAFAGGLGWKSQPKTAGFELLVEGKAMLRLDLADRPITWTSADGKVKLQFHPQRELPEDQLGLFYLTLPRDLFQPGKPAKLAVRSLGADSRRWFALHTYTDVP